MNFLSSPKSKNKEREIIEEGTSQKKPSRFSLVRLGSERKSEGNKNQSSLLKASSNSPIISSLNTNRPLPPPPPPPRFSSPSSTTTSSSISSNSSSIPNRPSSSTFTKPKSLSSVNKLRKVIESVHNTEINETENVTVRIPKVPSSSSIRSTSITKRILVEESSTIEISKSTSSRPSSRSRVSSGLKVEQATSQSINENITIRKMKTSSTSSIRANSSEQNSVELTKESSSSTKVTSLRDFSSQSNQAPVRKSESVIEIKKMSNKLSSESLNKNLKEIESKKKFEKILLENENCEKINLISELKIEIEEENDEFPIRNLQSIPKPNQTSVETRNKESSNTNKSKFSINSLDSLFYGISGINISPFSPTNSNTKDSSVKKSELSFHTPFNLLNVDSYMKDEDEIEFFHYEDHSFIENLEEGSKAMIGITRMSLILTTQIADLIGNRFLSINSSYMPSFILKFFKFFKVFSFLSPIILKSLVALEILSACLLIFFEIYMEIFEALWKKLKFNRPDILLHFVFGLLLLFYGNKFSMLYLAWIALNRMISQDEIVSFLKIVVKFHLELKDAAKKMRKIERKSIRIFKSHQDKLKKMIQEFEESNNNEILEIDIPNSLPNSPSNSSADSGSNNIIVVESSPLNSISKLEEKKKLLELEKKNAPSLPILPHIITLFEVVDTSSLISLFTRVNAAIIGVVVSLRYDLAFTFNLATALADLTEPWIMHIFLLPLSLLLMYLKNLLISWGLDSSMKKMMMNVLGKENEKSEKQIEINKEKNDDINQLDLEDSDLSECDTDIEDSNDFEGLKHENSDETISIVQENKVDSDEILPNLNSSTEPNTSPYAKLIIKISIRALFMMLAWTLRRLVVSFHTTLRGSQLLHRAILAYLIHFKIISSPFLSVLSPTLRSDSSDSTSQSESISKSNENESISDDINSILQGSNIDTKLESKTMNKNSFFYLLKLFLFGLFFLIGLHYQLNTLKDNNLPWPLSTLLFPLSFLESSLSWIVSAPTLGLNIPFISNHTPTSL